MNLRADGAKERNAKDKVLSVNVGWQLEARRRPNKKDLLLRCEIFILPETFGSRPTGYIKFEVGMKRFWATIRISVKNNETGATHKIELIRLPFSSRKFMLRFGGKAYDKIQEASFSQVCERIRKLLVIMSKQKFCTLKC